jgi:diguanylate cyclase (GGDEF)-like protein/PAS domain S-box-containing protein
MKGRDIRDTLHLLRPRQLAQVVSAHGHLAALLLVIAAIVALDALPAFRWAENALIAARMRYATMEASGQYVFVAIDSRSLRALGSWPWQREKYAELIEALSDAGAAEIFLDIDFSARSTPEADAALALALERAAGLVVLPVFMQDDGPSGMKVEVNVPLPEFSDPAWLAVVNLIPGPDGVVRRSPYGAIIDGQAVPSAASLLSGVFGPPGSDFVINFAIDPGTVPTASAIDVLEGRSPLDFTGKTAVIGAHAQELRRSVAVPVHGVLAGSKVHIVAAETLGRGRELKWFSRYVAIAALSVIVVPLTLRTRGRMPAKVATFFAMAVAIELLAFWAQARHSIIIPTPLLLATLLAANIMVAARELNLRKFLLQLARIEKSNVELVLEQVIADSMDAILIVDDRLQTVRISHAARELFGTEGCAEGSRLDSVVPAEVASSARAAMMSIAEGKTPDTRMRELTFEREGEERTIEYAVTPSRMQRAPGRKDQGTVIVCVTARDVTAERRQRLRIDRLARFDSLTGALNRAEFVERLGDHVRAIGAGCSVVAFSIFRLQTVNSTLGADVGDALLAAMVERVDAAGLGTSPVGRLGGDRFAVFTMAAADERAANRVAARLLQIADAPFYLGGHVVRIGLRVGVAPGGAGEGPELLLNKAELALDEARLATGRRLRTFDQTAFAKQARARQIERAHWIALAEQQMHVGYQPQVRLIDGALVGAEALVRWEHPKLGKIGPDEFIGIAEASGVIEQIGGWVLEEACLSAASWPTEISVSVNVSPVQINRGHFVEEVERAIDGSGLMARRLCLEITESVFFEASGSLRETFHRLRSIGVLIALDDFGSGFSSFGYLARLPLDKIKLDRIFVRDLETDPQKQAVTRSVASLCRELGLTLVAEGVETIAQRDALRALGCHEVQGYLFGRAQPQDTFFDRISEFPARVRTIG